jgi:hypothetical protein
MKLKYILENKILVPRRSKEEREKNLAAIHYKQIQEHIKNGSYENLNLDGSPLKTLPHNLIRVNGSLDLDNSQITSLNNLEHVEDGLYLTNSKITSLGNLKYVGGTLNLNDSPITSLGKLEYVGWSLDLENTPISKTHTVEQIKKQVEIVHDNIYL